MTDIPRPVPGDTDWIDWADDEEATSDAFRDGVSVAELSATGTPNATTFLRGDNTWAAPPGGTPTFANLPAGYTHTARKPGGVWEGSPTTRSDITIIWKGPDPSPPIVSSRTLGQAGMLDGVDTRFVTP